MPLLIIRNDIRFMAVDAIVNASDTALSGSGAGDAAIHTAAGPELAAECAAIGGCRVGEAVCTAGYTLPCKYIIHTAGPVWRGGDRGEREALKSCYISALSLAAEKKCESIALPLIAAGSLGFPKAQALRIAVDAVTEFLTEHEMQVYLAVFDRQSFAISEKLFNDVSQYIDDNYVEQYHKKAARNYSSGVYKHRRDEPAYECMCMPTVGALADADGKALALEEELGRLDESFQQMLLRKIDQSGMTDAQCYKKANIDRRHFAKIRADRLYKPTKATALAFAIALELKLEETEELLKKAGFALSPSSKFDVIVKYFLTRGNYNIFEINETLFAFDQNLLGS